MIRLSAAGCNLEVQVDLPPRFTKGIQQHYTTTICICNNEIATQAVVEVLQKAFEAKIAKIREEAYRQGVRDRAMKCKTFAGDFRTDMWHGGCAT